MLLGRSVLLLLGSVHSDLQGSPGTNAVWEHLSAKQSILFSH